MFIDNIKFKDFGLKKICVCDIDWKLILNIINGQDLIMYNKMYVKNNFTKNINKKKANPNHCY